MFDLDMPEILFILFIILILFGANRLPDVGRSFGKALGEFKKGLKESQKEFEMDANEDNKSSEQDKKIKK